MAESRVKVLLIEDNPEDARIMRQALAETKKDALFEVEWADRLAKGLERLRQGGIELVLTDLQLPDAKGLDTVVKVHAQAKEVPIVVLTSQDDGILATQALQQGAQDYLVKGYIQVYPDLLVRTMRYAIERKRAEEKEKELIEAVAVAVKKQAEEVSRAYQELKQTQAMLVQAEKMAAVGQLASGIAHEVRNPLNIILQCINYLEPDVAKQGGQQAELMEAMRESVKTADSIIRGLLDFSRPATLELKPMAVSAVIDSALILVSSQLASKKIQITKTVAPQLPPVLMDETQMKQVLLNLIINAVHAMPQGGQLMLRSELRRLTAAGKGVGVRANDAFRVGETVVAIEVEDTGSGISQEILSRVFNPFFTTKAPGEGVGLGLSITSTIVQAHSGVVFLESEVNRGTKAVILLPIPPGGTP